MKASVLVPVDGSSPARQAVEYTGERFPDATVTLLYVMDPTIDYGRRQAFPGYRDADGYRNEREKGEAVLNEAVDLLPADAAVVETATEMGEPARTILEYADVHDVDHIVIGSHGREGVARILLGSVAESVVRRAGVPVTVVHPRE